MKYPAGFTLIEAMIVLVIIGVLMSFAYPSYSAFSIRTRRTEGMVALIETMQQQERYYSQNNTYLAFSSSSTDPREKHFRWFSGSAPAASAYELRARACPGDSIAGCVELSAMPGTDKVDAKFRDRDCETLVLTSIGQRSSNGSSTKCWP